MSETLALFDHVRPHVLSHLSYTFSQAIILGEVRQKEDAVQEGAAGGTTSEAGAEGSRFASGQRGVKKARSGEVGEFDRRAIEECEARTPHHTQNTNHPSTLYAPTCLCLSIEISIETRCSSTEASRCEVLLDVKKIS
jgi:hypothetical protein